MIVEFQNTVGSSINSTRYPSLSPKLQAVKLLIADFLVQEDLLFSLSVFVSEVRYSYTHFTYGPTHFLGI